MEIYLKCGRNSDKYQKQRLDPRIVRAKPHNALEFFEMVGTERSA